MTGSSFPFSYNAELTKRSCRGLTEISHGNRAPETSEGTSRIILKNEVGKNGLERYAIVRLNYVKTDPA
jgi:hypothetical protein